MDMQTLSEGSFIRVPSHVLKLRMNKQKRTKLNSVNSTIKGVLLLPVRGNQFQAGHIYITAQGIKSGYVKIGFSRHNPVIREKQLSVCVANLRLVSYTRVPMPNGRRVESLVHAELTEHCWWVECNQCNQQHKEWFEIPLEVAEQVVL